VNETHLIFLLYTSNVGLGKNDICIFYARFLFKTYRIGVIGDEHTQHSFQPGGYGLAVRMVTYRIEAAGMVQRL